ncbi:hypothetical protein OCGS_0440 [Oceaniovalibus guishaninsula JLT2003]|uniref:Uncharacterized protein n=1 Tax=Oceaniovalibus guishaninsula JLT2003 TaxID=1231392 RepID=K2I8H2_9RHOB|nr:hypothetical protein OCGS_0440 [Oceaniovalibus guishaninsula JLT2003]
MSACKFARLPGHFRHSLQLILTIMRARVTCKSAIRRRFPTTVQRLRRHPACT